MDMKIFLEESLYIDFSPTIMQEKVKSLFYGIDDDVEKAKISYEYVRDEIPHTFNTQSDNITAKASDMLKQVI